MLTVKVIRAQMGTKATPTASLSIFISTRIHNVDARPVWCQLGKQQIIKPLLYIPPFVWSLWIFKWNWRPLTRTEGQTGISIQLSTYQTWNELKLRNIFSGWGCKRGEYNKSRLLSLWWSWRPWTAQRSESLHAELRGIWENLITVLSLMCVCEEERSLWVFFPQGCSSLLCKTMWPCAVRVNMNG